MRGAQPISYPLLAQSMRSWCEFLGRDGHQDGEGGTAANELGSGRQAGLCGGVISHGRSRDLARGSQRGGSFLF